MQYCHAGLVVRGLYVGYEAALKAAPQALLKGGYLLGGLIGGYDYLPAAGVEGIEGVEKLLLGGVLAGDELHIVYHEHVHIAVLVAELGVGVVLNGLYQLVGKGLAGDVGYAGGGVVLLYFVANGVHKVGLAKSGTSVDEQRIIYMTRCLSYCKCCGMCKIIIVTNDKCLKCIVRFKSHIHCFGRTGYIGSCIKLMNLFFMSLGILVRNKLNIQFFSDNLTYSNFERNKIFFFYVVNSHVLHRRSYINSRVFYCIKLERKNPCIE